MIELQKDDLYMIRSTGNDDSFTHHPWKLIGLSLDKKLGVVESYAYLNDLCVSEFYKNRHIVNTIDYNWEELTPDKLEVLLLPLSKYARSLF